MTIHTIRIPRERIGALIGPEGKTKEELEARAGVRIRIDSGTGDVNLDDAGAFEPVLALKVRDVIRAIGRGFGPDLAFRLFQDEAYLEVIDMTDVVGRSSKDLERVKSRLIGTRGKTRQAIEDATGAHMRIFGKTVSIVGDIEEVRLTREAIEMILSGAPHSVVYKFLDRKRKELRLHDLGL